MFLGSPAHAGFDSTLFMWCPVKPLTLPVDFNSSICSGVQLTVPEPVACTSSSSCLHARLIPVCREPASGVMESRIL